MSVLDHGALTDMVLAYLATGVAANPDVTTGKEPPIGDGVAPAAGGWVDGQPGSGIFVPYVTLMSGGAAPRALSPASVVPTWAVAFELRSTGGSRSQVDWMAKVARDSLDGLKLQRFGDPSWKVVNVEWVRLGPVTRNDATAPPTWQAADTVSLICDA